ncbi:unnamed protein product, partial [Ectocarpus sp. 8 AP-2014]
RKKLQHNKHTAQTSTEGASKRAHLDGELTNPRASCATIRREQQREGEVEPNRAAVPKERSCEG